MQVGEDCATDTGTDCPCPTSAVFCLDDGGGESGEKCTLVYSTECLWANVPGCENFWVFNPADGTVRRGIFPSSYDDYAGTPGCAGGIYTRTGGTGSGPSAVQITTGECACHGGSYCAAFVYESVSHEATVTEFGTTGTYGGSSSTAPFPDVFIDTNDSPVTAVLTTEHSEEAHYVATSGSCETGWTFTQVSTETEDLPETFSVTPGAC